MKRLLIALLCLGVLTVGVGPAVASTVTYTGENDKWNLIDWFDDGADKEPTAADNVVIRGALVTIDTAAVARSIVLEDGGRLVVTGGGTLAVGDDKVPGVVSVATGSYLAFGGADGENSENTENIPITSVEPGGRVAGTGIVLFNSLDNITWDKDLTLSGGLAVTVRKSEVAMEGAPDYTGNTNVNAGAGLIIAGTFTVAESATVTVRGDGFLAVVGEGMRSRTVVNNGTILLMAGDENGAELTVGPGTGVELVNNGTIETMGGNASLPKEGNFVINNGSTLTSNGTLTNGGKLENEGSVNLTGGIFDNFGVVNNNSAFVVRDGAVVANRDDSLFLNEGTVNNSGRFYVAAKAVYVEGGTWIGAARIPGEPPVTPPTPPAPSVDVPVTGIDWDLPSSLRVGTGNAITLEGSTLPASADVRAVVFDIVTGSEFATLTGNVLTGVKKGTVVVRATAPNGEGDGKDYVDPTTKNIEITESSGSSGGCSVGLGAFALAAAALALMKRK